MKVIHFLTVPLLMLSQAIAASPVIVNFNVKINGAQTVDASSGETVFLPYANPVYGTLKMTYNERGHPFAWDAFSWGSWDENIKITTSLANSSKSFYEGTLYAYGVFYTDEFGSDQFVNAYTDIKANSPNGGTVSLYGGSLRLSSIENTEQATLFWLLSNAMSSRKTRGFDDADYSREDDNEQNVPGFFDFKISDGNLMGEAIMTKVNYVPAPGAWGLMTAGLLCLILLQRFYRKPALLSST